MNYKFDDEEYEWFKKEFYTLSKMDLNKYKQDQMNRRIGTYVRRRFKLTYREFMELISNSEYELNAFLEYLTINVSEFFRNIEQWHILRDEIIPILKNNNSSKIRIWSSASSSGEEPYSLAMLFKDALGGQDFEIIATDIDLSILERAKRATYRLEDFDKIPEEYRKWFIKEEYDMYEIKPEIKEKVTFSKLDLLREEYPTDIDLLVCRNVLIYFIEDAKNDIYRKFSKSLTDKGILFVGSSEQIVGSTEYDLKAIRTYFYQKEKNRLIYR